MPDLMTIDVPDISAARAERVWAHVLATATREQVRTRRRRAVGTSAGATTLAGILGFAMLTPASSFASWTEVPTPMQVDLGDPSVATCIGQLTDAAQSRARPTEQQPLLGERRGDFTTVLLAGQGSLSICIADDNARAAATKTALALPAGQIMSVVGNGGPSEGEGARYVFGRVAGEVRGVSVVTQDGIRIVASVGGGYFVAWWPGSTGPATVTATDESGAVLTSLTLSEG